MKPRLFFVFSLFFLFSLAFADLGEAGKGGKKEKKGKEQTAQGTEEETQGNNQNLTQDEQLKYFHPQGCSFVSALHWTDQTIKRPAECSTMKTSSLEHQNPLETNRPPEPSQVLNFLYSKIQSFQSLVSKNFSVPALSPQVLSGLYQSSIHLNFQSSFQRSVGFPDTNGFATAFIVGFLLESIELLNGTEAALGIDYSETLNDQTILLAVNRLAQLQDPNAPGYPGAPVHDFWPPAPLNVSNPYFKAVIYGNLTTGPPMPVIQYPANYIGLLEYLWSNPQIAQWVEKYFPSLAPILEQFEDQGVTEFFMCSDFDDSALNIMVGAKLNQLKETANGPLFQQSIDGWNNNPAPFDSQYS